MVQAGTQHDRLAAALEAIVIGDRRACYPKVTAELGWQEGLLQTAAAIARGERLSVPHWQAHFQSLTSSAVALNALPYLWVMADAHGHHRVAVHRWVEDLELSPAAAVACEQLFAILCQQMGAAHSLSALAPLLPSRVSSWNDSGPVAQALSLVVQSQGQFEVAFGLACHREWSAAIPPRGGCAIALVSLLTGLTGGRVGLGAALRQRWLLDYRPAQPDPWQGVDVDALAAALHRRWAGVALPNIAPSFP
ncbi:MULTISPECIES: hypothetical protein [Cyanophyceae]|uniref:hypothetical protein n=1 Tax=Cyanophyceae TaxID=3028117 RepID=UPI001683D691|nr:MULTISPECIES: hypothetical protein [Cyanophyceae]MBD1917084.1 hypothetical protein [Phormidium sp. FACHB-77]MBD2030615.1 hypothetical protein [Phormidium sp. FACHB-322]MBD2050277.1 hypothetical protein [Leptolyngbya sp. FACHB-60]